MSPPILMPTAAARHCLLLASLSLFTAAASGQGRPIRFQQLSLQQGLSQGTVLDVMQDSQGFVWVATEGGLNRYNGTGFRTYYHDPTDSGTLPNNFVWAIDEDASGQLWLATDSGGLGKWIRRSGRFARFQHDPDDPRSVASNNLRTLLHASEGTLWIGTGTAGLDRLDTTTGSVIEHYRHDSSNSASLSNDRVFALLEDRSGDIWVGTDDGLNRYSIEHDSFTRFGGPGSSNQLSDQRIRSLFKASDGGLWIGTYSGGIHRVDPEDGSLVIFQTDPDRSDSLSHNRVYSVLEDDANRIWVGTVGGLDLYDPSTGTFAHYRNDEAVAFSLSDNAVRSIFQDRGGVLWIGTVSGGLNKWDTHTWRFGFESSRLGGLEHSNVTSFSKSDDGQLWVGTMGGGLTRLDRVGSTATHFRHQPRVAGALPSDLVMSLLHDHQGDLWVGTMDAGVCRYDGRGGFQVFSAGAGEGMLSDNRIVVLKEDKAGDIWIGTFGGGLNRWDRRSGRFETFPPGTEPGTLSEGRVISIAEGEGGLWIGTDGGGLNWFERETRHFRSYRHDPTRSDSLSGNTVYALHAVANGGVWVGTRGSGLQFLDSPPAAEDQASFKSWAQRDGLPNNTVYGVLPDDAGHLWLSTNLGLSRFDPETGTFDNYSVDQGLQSNEFNFGASYRSGDGELFFGGPQGFNAFRPNQITINDHQPPVVLTSFLKFNRPAQSKLPPSQIERIDLAYNDDVVTFEFAALDYAAPERNQYAYQLEGFDPEWTELGAIRRVTYTNLEAANYTFRVRASNSDGVWNNQGLAIPITVAAAPWNTPLAKGLYAAGGLLAFLGIAWRVRKRLARQRDYSRQLETQVAQRTSELAERATELEHLNQRLEEVSITDSLTGLGNRRFLEEYLDREVALLQRQSRSSVGRELQPLAFLMIDLDRFKKINDSCGHGVGDEVLRGVGGVLREVCRASDVLIRWGGDEFLVVGCDADLERLEALAERIRSRIADLTIPLKDGSPVKTTCSIGFASYPFLNHDLDALSWEQVINVADRALYVAKKSSTDAWVGFLANTSTKTESLLREIWNNPQSLFEGGQLELRTSLSATSELQW